MRHVILQACVSLYQGDITLAQFVKAYIKFVGPTLGEGHDRFAIAYHACNGAL